MSLVEQIWEDGQVVDDWKNAAVVPIPKKGDLPVGCCRKGDGKDCEGEIGTYHRKDSSRVSEWL